MLTGISSSSEVQKKGINTLRSQTQGESSLVTGAPEFIHVNKNAEPDILFLLPSRTLEY